MIMNCRRIIVPFTRTIFSGAHFQSGSRKLSDGENSLERLYAVPPSKYDIMLPDMNPLGLNDISDYTGVRNLSSASFPEKPFPVNGLIFGLNNRLMVCLVSQCQYPKKRDLPDFPIVNIWYLVDTTSNYTFLNKESILKLFGDTEEIPKVIPVAIQDKNKGVIEGYLSHSNFSGANIIGMMTLLRLGVSIENISKEKGTFQLVSVV